jgi:hypothetical protein
VLEGHVSTCYTTGGRLGKRASAILEITCSPFTSRIDIAWTFTFDQASIGNFYQDDTKLRVRWPLGFMGTICHDIGFGVIEERPSRTFTPAGWTDVSDGEKGFAYLHRGTPKTWVEDGVLTNLFAWGEFTEAIGSRMWRHNWMKCFDQRLNGTHRIEAAIVPHPGTWQDADIPGMCRQFHMPPIVRDCAPHDGTLPSSSIVLAVEDSGMIVTSVRGGDDEITCRHYRTRAGGGVPTSELLFKQETTGLAGDERGAGHPYRIEETTFARKQEVLR